MKVKKEIEGKSSLEGLLKVRKEKADMIVRFFKRYR